jgi:hypothetical protein
MALTSKDLVLDTGDSIDGPTIDGGLEFASAAGGLPARITPITRAYANVTSQLTGPVFDADGVHFWASPLNNTLTQRRIDTGATNLTSTLPSGSFAGIQRFGNLIYAGNVSNGNYHEIDTTNGVVNLSIATGDANGNKAIRVAGTTGKIWTLRFSAGVPTERVLSTGVATGRTLPISAFDIATVGSDLYAIQASPARIFRYDEATLTLQSTVSPVTSSYIATGTQNIGTEWRSVNPASVSDVILRNARNGWIESWDMTNSSATLNGRVGFTSIEYDGGIGEGTTGILASRPSTDVNVAGNQIIVATHDPANPGSGLPSRVIIRQYGTQTATWSWTPTNAVTVKGMDVPGNLARQYDGVTDWRRARCYYKVGPNARVEFSPGDRLNISVGSGVVFQVIVDFRDWGTPFMTAWIADAGGVLGPRIWYDDPTAIDIDFGGATGTATVDEVVTQLIDTIQGVSLATGVDPDSKTSRPFIYRTLQERNRAFAVGHDSDFRKFDVLPGDLEELGYFGNDAVRREQDFSIEITYPVDRGFYGENGLRTMDRIMHEDATAIRNAIMFPSSFLDAMQKVDAIWTIEDEDDLAILVITASVQYLADSRQG